MRRPLLLATLGAVLFFANLGAAHLWDVDEAIFAAAAKEMFARGDHVVPYFNGEVFTHKPAMMYWFMIGAYEWFGPTEFAARFWSAIFGVGSVLLTYRLGKLMFSPTVGFLSGLVLATNVNYTLIARAATPDSFLVFFSTLALLVFVSGTGLAKAKSASSLLKDALSPDLGATAGLSSSVFPTSCKALLGKPAVAPAYQPTANSKHHGADDGPAPWAGQTRFEPSWITYAGTYAAMGCGVLTKGPIGVLLPTAVIGLFLLIVRAQPCERSRRSGWQGSLENTLRWAASVGGAKHFLRTVWSMRPLTAIAVVLAVAGPWYALVGVKTDGAWLIGFFGVHNFGRFFGAMENHRGPIFYYLVAIAIGFFPWSVLFSPSFSTMRKRLAGGDPWRPGYVLVISWFAVWVGFFSLAGTKLPSYVVPAYPALALFTGAFVDGWLREPRTVSPTWNRLIWGTVALAGVGMLIAFPIVAHLYLGDDWILGAVGLIPFVAAVVGFTFGRRQQPRAAFATLTVLGITLAIALFAFGAARVDRFQASARFGQLIAANTPPGEQPAIGSFNYFRPSLVFYTDRPIAEFGSQDNVQTFFATHPESAFLFTTDDAFEELAPTLPEGVVILDSRPRFLHAGRILLLSRRLRAATAQLPANSGTHVQQ